MAAFCYIPFSSFELSQYSFRKNIDIGPPKMKNFKLPESKSYKSLSSLSKPSNAFTLWLLNQTMQSLLKICHLYRNLIQILKTPISLPSIVRIKIFVTCSDIKYLLEQRKNMIYFISQARVDVFTNLVSPLARAS